MTINGIELELNLLDADTAEQFESAVHNYIAATAAIKDQHIERVPDQIRAQCHAIFDFTDAVFGENTHHKIFGEKCDLVQCIDVYEAILNEKRNQEEQFNQRLQKYLPNRAQRRADK